MSYADYNFVVHVSFAIAGRPRLDLTPVTTQAMPR